MHAKRRNKRTDPELDGLIGDAVRRAQEASQTLNAFAELVEQIGTLAGDDERGPTDPGLRLYLEAVNHLDADEQNAIRTLIEGTLLRHQARRLAAS